MDRLADSAMTWQPSGMRKLRLSGAMFLAGLLSACASHGPAVVSLRTLPAWSGDISTLTWVNPTSVSTERSQTPQLPGISWQVIYPYALHSHAPTPALPLPGGYTVALELKPPQDDGLENRLTIINTSTGKEHSWLIQLNRQDWYISRVLSLMGGRATAFYAVAINQRYLAFLTADPGWIFFDRQQDQFLPLIVQGDPNYLTPLYLTPDGQALMGYRDNASNLRVLSMLQPAAPLSASDILLIKQLNADREQRQRDLESVRHMTP